MGLLNFWKKKDLDLPPVIHDAQNPELLTDLPSIDGNVDGSNVQQFGISPADAKEESKSISVNVPTLDFSLPAAEDITGAKGQSNQPNQPLGMPGQQDMGQSGQLPQMNMAQGEAPDDIDANMRKLFFNDDTWKEPDWNTFDPYTEDKIDEPKPDDFKGEDLPAFEDQSQSQIVPIAEPVSEPAEPETSKKPPMRPVELFIRGKAYQRVFTELNQMNKTLSKIDSQVGSYDEMLKREEPLLQDAKEQMESLYKKMNTVDKKVFAQG